MLQRLHVQFILVTDFTHRELVIQARFLLHVCPLMLSQYKNLSIHVLFSMICLPDSVRNNLSHLPSLRI